jgi:hypothetical protein
MFISHEDILYIRSGNLNDPEWERNVLERIFRTTTQPENWKILKTWLMLLPEAEKAKKIVDGDVKRKDDRCVGGGFRSLAQECGAKLTNLHWWDIDQEKRHLMATISRNDGIQAPILFLWKKRRDPALKEQRPMLQGHAAWEWNSIMSDPSRSCWRFAIEGEAFDNVIETYINWLRAPREALHLPENFEPQNAA